MINGIIERYKSLRNRSQLRQCYEGRYAFVGIGNHSINNLYPVLDYLRVPLKYICCKSPGKLPLIERKWDGVRATASLDDVLSDEEVKGVFVSASPAAHFNIARRVLTSGKSLFIEKPPCMTMAELRQLTAQEQESASPVVMVGMQKRHAPAIRILANRLKKETLLTYSMRYLTGAYPEGNALTDLFIHPLDLACHLFGGAEIRGCEHVERKGRQTILLILGHKRITGIMELSTAGSWTDATESLTVNTTAGIYELNQMENLTYKPSQVQLLGIPLEKIMRRNLVTETLFSRNNFVPTIPNNQIYTQGYFNEIKYFVDAIENNIPSSRLYGFGSMDNTFRLLDCVSKQ